MKFIHIKEGLSVAINKIDTIESLDGVSSRITLSNGNGYTVDKPYASLMFLLENAASEDKNAKTMDKLNKYLSVATVQTI